MTRFSILIISSLFLFPEAIAQNVGINSTGATPAASAGLDIDFTNKGLLIPRVALTATNAAGPVTAPATSLLVYNTATAGAGSTAVTPGYYYWNGASWVAFGGSGSNNWSLTGNAGTSTATNFIGTTDAVDWIIRTNNTERMRVLSGGNVGIGTTAPTQKLDVQGGNARINNTFLGDVGHGSGWGGFSSSATNNTTGYGMLQSTDGNYTLINKENTGGGYIGFRIANADVAVITNAGRLGVGTTSPPYLLTVAPGGTFGYGDGTAAYSSRTESRADAGLQASQSGFFQTAAPAPAANWPVGASSWWHLLDVRHSNDANNYAMQFAGSFFDQNLYFRKTNGSASTAWSQVLTTSTSLTQGITMSSATTESIIGGNNTGTYSAGAGVGYTPGTYIAVPGLSTTRTITTGNVVQVNFSARWETDNYNYYAPEMAWFRILRDGVPIATSAAYFDGGVDWYFTDGNITINLQDVGATPGAHTWTVDCWMTNSWGSTEAFFIGERYLTVTEIKP